jgi:hypothetical protein
MPTRDGRTFQGLHCCEAVGVLYPFWHGSPSSIIAPLEGQVVQDNYEPYYSTSLQLSRAGSMSQPGHFLLW